MIEEEFLHEVHHAYGGRLANRLVDRLTVGRALDQVKRQHQPRGQPFPFAHEREEWLGQYCKISELVVEVSDPVVAVLGLFAQSDPPFRVGDGGDEAIDDPVISPDSISSLSTIRTSMPRTRHDRDKSLK